MEAGMKKEMDVREEGKQEAKATAMRVSVVSVTVNLVL